MQQQVLEKRTSETLRFDLGCWRLLPPGVTIVGTPTMAPSEPAGLVFGAPVVNASPVTYLSGFVAPAGTVVQLQISGGAVAPGKARQRYVIRCTFATSIGGELAEATAALIVSDQP